MPRARSRSALAHRSPTFVLVLLGVVVLAALTSGRAAASAPPETAPPATVAAAEAGEEPTSSVGAAGAALADNEFLPERENVSDCFGALERPNCGSDAKGGWRQGLVFGLLAVGVAVIAWRVAVAVRRRDRAVNAP